MDRHKHILPPYRRDLASPGLCIISGALVATISLLLTYISFPQDFFDSVALLVLSLFVFGMVIPALAAMTLYLAVRQLAPHRLERILPWFQVIHWLVYVPLVALVLAPTIILLWPSVQSSGEEERFAWTVVFGMGAALPVPIFQFLRMHGAALLRNFTRDRVVTLPEPPVRLRRRVSTTLPRRRTRQDRSRRMRVRFLGPELPPNP